ncbi:hypothetical protein CA54_38660 [Symmachiella macrocystis]|uniref:Uncharacterized protein n=1 Tax=Symmachiella macrocystis TaxID=2527985 RepID=A0A5C6BAF5_9PLAN|nr:hypothetical protein [Symmachiella macrocystis]TWU08632.1 hypothetical protein CA54_38660 [Symmachiella macrocystis]
MGLPYSSVTFSLAGEMTGSTFAHIVDRISSGFVQPLVIRAAVPNSQCFEIIDPWGVDKETDHNYQTLRDFEVPYSNPIYSRFVGSVTESVWENHKDHIVTVLDSYIDMARDCKSWTWLKLWGPTHIITSMDGKVSECWAFRERHEASDSWGHLIDVSIDYEPESDLPIMVNLFIRTFALSYFSSTIDPNVEDWTKKDGFARSVAKSCCKSLAERIARSIEGFRLIDWEFENSSRVDLVGELPKYLSERLDVGRAV